MHFRGTYQKTLARILSAVAIIMALLISVLSGAFLERQTHAEYEYHLEQTAKSQESSATIASNVILNTVLKCASNQSIIRWVNSSSLPEYYFNAIEATKGLQESINNTLPIEYQCALMPLSVKAFNGKIVDMVLTHNRTMAVSELLSTLHIDQQEYLRLIDHFYDSDEPYFLARYDQESQDLENMIYIMKANNTKNTKIAFLIFVTIPRETFVAASEDEDFFLYNSSGIFAYSHNTEEFQKHCQQIYEKLSVSKSAFYYGKAQNTSGGYLLVTGITPFQWLMASIYPSYKLPTETLLIFFIVVFLTIGLFLYTSYHLVERLYRPMEELMESSSIPAGQTGEAIDEFAIIRNNIEENSKLAHTKAYKDLLFTRKPDLSSRYFQYPDASYCVSLGETMNPEDEHAFHAIAIQKAAAYELSIQQEQVIYIDLDYNRYALIIRTDSIEEAKQLLTQLLNQLEDQEDLSVSDHRVVLSDIHKGLDQLYLCYHEALRILEFRYLHAKTRLITYRDISSIDAATYYSYPLQTEKRLIQCVLDGKEEALDIFDDVIRENIANKDLSRENLQNLIYAFIGTISRIFQELKTTPDAFLDDPIDYKYLYSHWNDAIIFKKLKNILETVINKVRQREDSRDQDLLNQMLNYIYENYWDDIMLNDLAEHLNISPKYCGILFKQLSDNNFKDFLNRYRIEKAKEILRDDPSIKIVDLSAMVGFNSSNSFIRVFSKYEGITPGAYVDRIQHS